VGERELGERVFRGVVFVGTTLLAALVFNVALFITLAFQDSSRYVDPTECRTESAECGRLMEFTYDDTWPLVAFLLLIPAALLGWFVTRLVSRRLH
jgi:hypothetical protein